jgi:predicted RNA polymerase sigma factor
MCQTGEGVRQEDDTAGRARELLDEGFRHTNSDLEGPALDLFSKALTLARDGRLPLLELEALNAVGLAYFRRRDWPRALGAFERSLDAARSLGDRVREGDAWHNVGLTRERLAARREALEAYQQAVPILEEAKRDSVLPYTLHGIARLLAKVGPPPEAVTAYERAITCLRDWGHNPAELSQALGGRARVLERAGRFEEAEAAYVEAISALHRAGARRAALRLRVRAGTSALRRGRIGAAFRHLVGASGAAP